MIANLHKRKQIL